MNFKEEGLRNIKFWKFWNSRIKWKIRDGWVLLTMGCNMVSNRTFLCCCCCFIRLRYLFRVVEFIHKVAGILPSPLITKQIWCWYFALALYIWPIPCNSKGYVARQQFLEHGRWRLAWEHQCLTQPTVFSVCISNYFSILSMDILRFFSEGHIAFSAFLSYIVSVVFLLQ